MPKLSQQNNNENINIGTEDNDRIKRLEEENAELQKKLNKIIELMQSSQSTKINNVEVPIVDNNIEYEEPLPNKNIKIISLYYGSLNLSDGINTKLSFDKYGQVKNCLYSKLVDIVNHDIKFAQEGLFYIADKAAVYHLGLSDYYKKIQPKDVLDNICNYDNNIIISIGQSLTDSQKETLSFGIAKRMFDGEIFDLNKIEVLSKAINTDIKKMVEDMQSFEESRKEE